MDECHYPSLYFVECWYQGLSLRGYRCYCEFSFWEDNHILVVFLSLIRSWRSGQGIRWYVCLSRDVEDVEVVLL